MMRRRLISALLGLALLFTAIACAPEPPPLLSTPWVYADLRALDAPQAQTTTQDLLALYARIASDEIQIRLDLLEHPARPDFDLYLALDSQPGGSRELPLDARPQLAWDTLLVIPASGPMQVLDARLQPKQGSGLRVLRDPLLDTLAIGFDRGVLTSTSTTDLAQSKEDVGPGLGFRMQAFLTEAGSTSLADELGPAHSQAFPPPPARVLFAFWNTYLAYTPTTALRRWDGAHTGPAGGRHGLYNLLRTAQAAGMPLALLDLKNPASLSALDYVGNRAIVGEMLAGGLLILPDYLPDLSPTTTWAFETILEQNRAVAQDFGLSPSPFLYSPSGPLSLTRGKRLTFVQVQDENPTTEAFQPTTASRWRDQLILPIRQEIGALEQATSLGPSLDVRRALVETAWAAAESGQDGTLLLVLGGNLPASTWGDPQAARETFRYLAAHPWVRPLSADDLLGLKPAASPYHLSPAASRPAEDELLAALRQAPDNLLGLAAWQCWQALYTPVHPTSSDLPALRANYTGQVWSLLAAAQWAENPIPQAECDQDVDHDGQAECILASDSVFALMEIESGALAFAFSGDPAAAAVHQLVGPSSQFISGLSDPSFWDLEGGMEADPAVIPGAFAEPGMGYTVSVEDQVLVFTSADSHRRKRYWLTPSGLRFEYRGLEANSAAKLRLPLALDPWRRFESGWADQYQSLFTAEGWVWQLDPDLKVQILSSIPFTTQDFLASRPLLMQTEDPNMDYPAGHLLAFPLALVEFTAQQDYFVEITWVQEGE